MTEQPAEDEIYIEISKRQAAGALATYSLAQGAIDAMLAVVSNDEPELNRVDAEDLARRVVMSGCLCKELNLTAETDAKLFENKAWQELLRRLMDVYDKNDIGKAEA